MVAIFTGSGVGFERGSGSVLGSAGLLGSSTLGRGGEQLFLNAATGNFMVSQRDEYLVGLGLDASVARTYNSLGDLSDDNSDNWRQGYDRRIANLTGTLNSAGSTVQRVSGDGSLITYTWDAGKSAYVATDGAGAHDTLTSSGGVWTWTDGDSQVKESYQAYGAYWRLASQADSDGNTVSFSYTGDKLAQVTTAGSGSAVSTLTYTWSGNNLTSVTTGYTDLAASTAKTLTRTSYSYDGQNRLSTVTVDLTPENTADSQTYVTTYTYDGTSTRVASISQSDGSNLAVTYDGSGRVATLAQTASSGVTRTTSLNYGSGYTEVTDPLGLVTRLDYGAAGQLTKITMPPASAGASAQTIQFAYEPNGTPATLTNHAQSQISGNSSTKLGTSGWGNHVAYGNELMTGSATVSFKFDDPNTTGKWQQAGLSTYDNRTVAGTFYADGAFAAGIFFDNFSNALMVWDGGPDWVRTSVTGLSSDTWTISYDGQQYSFFKNGTLFHSKAAASNQALVFKHRAYSEGAVCRDVTYGRLDGQLKSVTDALGNVTSYSNFDANGNAQTITDRLGNIVTRTYGARNELLTETTTSSDAASSAAAHTVRFAYDGENHLRYRISAEGLVTEYRYTAAGQLEWTVEYPEHWYDVSALGSTTALSEAQLNSWRDAIADKSSVQLGLNVYDARGNLFSSESYGIATSAGASSIAEGTSKSFFVYDQAGRLVSRNAQGRNAETFVYDGMGRLTAAVDVNGATTTYVFNDAATTTTVTYANGLTRVSTFNKAGELISLAESAAATTLGSATGTATYAYDKDGRLRWSQDATGRKSYFLYDQLGRKVADVSSAGDVVVYRYDVGNRLTATIVHGARYTGSFTALDDPNAIIDPATYIPSANASDLWSWNIYDKEGRLLQSIAGDGSTSVFGYDGAGRLVSTISYYNKLAAGTLTGFKTTLPTAVTPPTTDAKDAVARSFYDKDGRLLGILDGEGFLSRIVYDKAGQKISETAYYNATSAALRASGTFNALVASVTLDAARDRTVNHVHDGQGQLRYVIDGLGFVTQTDYDSAGQAISVARYAAALAATSDYSYDNVKALVASGNLPASVGSRKSWVVYDSAGRAAYTIDPEGGVSANSYNAAGQLIKTTSFSVVRSTTSLPTKATMDSWAAANASAANDRVTRFYYDGSGQPRYTVDAEGYVSRSDVDAEGRVTKVSSWANKVTIGDSTTLDILHGLVTSSGGTVAETLTSYDALGRVETVTDAEGSITRLAYGANGLVSDRTIAWGTSDASTTHYVHDGAGRAVETHSAYGSPEVSIVKASYDGLGNVLTVTDPNNKVTTYAYDRLGQLLTETDALSGVTSYQYDAFGAAVKVTDKRGNSAFSYYDKLGRLVASRDAEDHVTETSYTAFGEMLSVTRRYDKATGAAAVGTLPTVTANPARDAVTSFEYDRLGRVTRTTDAQGYYEQYTLDAFGSRLSVRNKLGGIVTNMFDRRGLLISETLPMSAWRADGTLQASSVTNKFEYDARGNRTKMIEAFGLTEQRTTNYAYDKLGRLTSKTLDAVTTVSYSDFTSTTAVTVTTTASVVPTESYVYDAAGRLKQVTDAYGGRSVSFYDDLGRKTAEVGPMGTMTAWTYDAAGNMLTVRVYGDAVAVPLATATVPPNPINASNYRETAYTYDNLGRLKTTSIANVLAGSYNGSTGVAPTTITVTTTLDYDANGNAIKATDANGNVVYSYYDKLGRKAAQADAENYLTAWTYDAEGNVLSETRFATQYVGTPVAGGTPPTVTADALNDRTTSFTYDRNGHRLTETRANVKIAAVSTVNGAITESTVSSAVTYSYNGLGQVLTKQEATGDIVSYTYDSTGRLTREARAAYDDHVEPDSTTVTPTVDYLYNGLNNLSRTRQGGASAQAGDRITTYAYGANGRLASMTDPAGGTHAYDYDAAGNLVRDSYARLKSDGTTSVNEGILYRRDLLGRIIGQAIATKVSATSWTRGDGQNSEYNAFGDISRRGLNGLWQESFSYNNRGLVEKSNTGDGVWRFFVYDKQGNKTLTIEDEHYTAQDLGTKTIADVLGYLGATAGATFVDGLNVSIATYDKRGQALSSIMPSRELKTGDPRVTITSSQAYNAFGEIKSQTDARGFTTDFTYSTMGRLIKKELPLVNWTNTAGVVASARPAEQYYYDGSGRLVASRDANGNLLSRTLLAGSGYGEAEALVTDEFHADGGIARTFYDVFGDARTLRNELGFDETRTYDAMGRLITQVHRGGLLTDNYTYDILGQRTRHWNSFLGSGNVEKTDYDLQGRVVSSQAFGGDTTTTSFTWDAAIATSGMGTFGGWLQVDTYANSKTMQVKSDVFGHDTWKSDLGAHIFTFAYDKAGRQVTRTTTGETLTTTWLNSGLMAKLDFGVSDYATYSYDAGGNHLSEYTVRANVVVQNAAATYDALGRMLTWNEVGGTVSPAASKSIEYDLNGNIRKVASTNSWIDAQGNFTTGGSTTEYFLYDAMNRLTLDKGLLSGGQIVRGTTGISYTYDVAGNRKSATRSKQLAQLLWRYTYNNTTTWWENHEDFYGGSWAHTNYYFTGNQRDTYNYNTDGTLDTVQSNSDTAQANGTGSPDIVPMGSGAGTVIADFTYDAMGRLTRQLDYPASASYDRTITYNSKGQISSETAITKQGSDTYKNIIANSFGTGSGYALGSVTSFTSDNYKNNVDSDAKDESTTNSYSWYDGAVQSLMQFDRDTGDSNNSIYTSTYNLGVSGVLTSVSIVDGRSRTVTFKNDMGGQVIKRDESDGDTTKGDPHEVWYRFNGREVAMIGNNGTMDLDYSTTVDKRTAVPPATPGAFRFGSTSAINEVDMHNGPDAINSYVQGAAGGRRTVEAGETLQSIALAVWGDETLWYKLAEANGLSGSPTLVEGQELYVPAGVQRSANNADSFKPYDPAETIGNTSPTTRKPPKKQKCGVFGQLFIAVIAIAVAVILAPTIIGTPAALSASGAIIPATGLTAVMGSTAAGIVGGAIAGAVGSIVSQGVGVATGVQDKFSWKGVALSALAGGIGGGVGPLTGLQGASGFNGVLQGIARGALSSAITQGIGVVTGLQDKFDWAGVAAAGVGSGVGAAVGTIKGFAGLNQAGQRFATSMASGVANAATRSLVNGSDFGDNLLAALPDVLGQTIGGMIADGVVSAFDRSDEIVVTANGGTPGDVLSGGKINDPALKALVDQAKGYNLKGLENDYEDARSDAREIEVKLAKARAESNAKRVANLEKELAKRQVRVAQTAEAFAPALAADRALQQYFVGKDISIVTGSVTMKNGVPQFDTDARPIFVNGSSTTTYRMQGPSANFATPDEAGFDAIAMARAVSAARGDSSERTGYIVARSNGTYTYEYPYQLGGTIVQKTYSIGRELSAPVDQSPIPRNAVGMWHIHPRGGSGDNIGNIYFGPGDITAAQQVAARISKSSFAAYLGGSDGGVRVIRNANTYPIGFDGSKVPHKDYSNIGPGYFPLP